MSDLIKQIEKEQLKGDAVDFAVGDTVEVSVRITEGERQRLHVFSGIVISRRGGGLKEMFTVRRIVGGEGVERTFPMNSPAVESIKVVRRGDVRRSKLYYLRDRVGKATRVKEKLARKS
jgi:large subunit ribosomal protein L19